MTENHAFWEMLEELLANSELVLDRPTGTPHPRYPGLVYPVDYGYLAGTASMDGDGIDVWRGTDGDRINAVVCTVDAVKKDSEIKLLVGCTEEEKAAVYEFHNRSDYQKGVLIRRGTIHGGIELP